jgi:hypothetical protein
MRHHPKGSDALTVYELADQRLPEIVARDLRGEEFDTPAAGAGAEDTPGD